MQPIGLAVYSSGVDAHECLADDFSQTVLISRCVAPDGFFLVGRSVNAHDVFIAFLVVKTIDFAEREHVDGVALVVGSVDARLNKIGGWRLYLQCRILVEWSGWRRMARLYIHHRRCRRRQS